MEQATIIIVHQKLTDIIPGDFDEGLAKSTIDIAFLSPEEVQTLSENFPDMLPIFKLDTTFVLNDAFFFTHDNWTVADRDLILKIVSRLNKDL